MKKEDLPQDVSALNGLTREVCYVKDAEGNYTTDLSSGWEAKKVALDNEWSAINDRVKEAENEVEKGIKSPIHYFMELNLMDLQILSGYTGFWQITIKRHLKPKVFESLSDHKLQKYADAFNISIDQLKKLVRK